MKVRHSFEWVFADEDFPKTHVIRKYSDDNIYQAHSETGPADIDKGGSVIWRLGDEIVYSIAATAKLWRKYGDQAIRNANKAP